MEQITIFDYLKEINRIPSLQELLDKIEQKYGIKFDYTERFREPEYVHNFCKSKKSELSISERTFNCKDQENERFISVDYAHKSAGFACPCTTLSSIYGCIDKAIKMHKEEVVSGRRETI